MAGLATETKPLLDAAMELITEQDADGSWRVDAESAIGSPATYGAPLATYMARRTLEKAGAARFAVPVARADDFLMEATVDTTIDASAVILALHDRRRPKAAAATMGALTAILSGQSSDGGWGPYRGTPSEAFDTAIAMLALVEFGDQPNVRDRIRRGRELLIKTQLPSGGWQETTRPSGSQRYAQHLSTSGWATQALLKTSALGR